MKLLQDWKIYMIMYFLDIYMTLRALKTEIHKSAIAVEAPSLPISQ